ncbi:MAG: hypothetical protein AAGA03_20325 [Planctomycetota bacterium]
MQKFGSVAASATKKATVIRRTFLIKERYDRQSGRRLWLRMQISA